MKKHNKFALLILLGGLLGGCESNYHAFDGKSGYKFTSLSSDQFVIQFYGNQSSSQRDVEVMWHHKARELCKGGAYQHQITASKAQRTGIEAIRNTGFVPKERSHFILAGEVSCLAPSLAIKLNQESELLSDENLASNQLVGGSAAN